MRFCLDQFGERVFIDDAMRGETYYCPECGEKMVQRHGEIRTPHFAHYPNTQCTDAWRYDESDWHVKYQSMFPKENQEIIKELDAKKHRADVLYEDRKTVIEIQGERLRQDEFEQRNKFFNALGYKVIWLFDESRIFENKSINYGFRKMACTREWLRPSRTFSGFDPEKSRNQIEVWFQRTESGFEDQPRFFKILSSPNSLRTMECGFCHSLKELMKYLIEGKRTPDYGALYDIKYGVCRTDGSISVYRCPKKMGEVFTDIAACGECPFQIKVPKKIRPYQRWCAYRFDQMTWDFEGEIVSFSRRNDGFIDSITFLDSEKSSTVIGLDCPKTFLRNLPNLWDKYKPARYVVAFNTVNNTVYSVFNPGWQKHKNRVIKGRIVSEFGRLSRTEEVVPNAEEPVWFVVHNTNETAPHGFFSDWPL